MVLEASVIIMDNSQYMRNGDYPPSRMEAQHDAINFLATTKTRANPENSVGIIAGAGVGKSRNRVVVTLTPDMGQIITSMHNIDLGGNYASDASLEIAQLVLRHRQNKNQRQRIIMFVGSPLDIPKTKWTRMAKKLKKNNIAVDVVSFGEPDVNAENLEHFISTVNNNGNSHLVTIPPGPHLLVDLLCTSPICIEEGGGGGMGGGGTGASGIGTSSGEESAFEFGVDPNMDPELAMALRLSLEEERARQEALASSAAANSNEKEKEKVDEMEKEKEKVDEMKGIEENKSVEEQKDEDMEDAILLATSMQNDSKGFGYLGDEIDEDEAIKLALAMSVAQSDAPSSTTGSSKTSTEIKEKTENEKEKVSIKTNVDDLIQDKDFLSNVIASLPGVDAADGKTVQNVLNSLVNEEEFKDKENQDKDKDVDHSNVNTDKMDIDDDDKDK